MVKHPVEGRPNCQECYQKRRKEIAEAIIKQAVTRSKARRSWVCREARSWVFKKRCRGSSKWRCMDWTGNVGVIVSKNSGRILSDMHESF